MLLKLLSSTLISCWASLQGSSGQQTLPPRLLADDVRFCEQVKPDIVFFGEGLPQRFFSLADVDFDSCDLLIVMGSSLVVQPFASLIGALLFPASCSSSKHALRRPAAAAAAAASRLCSRGLHTCTGWVRQACVSVTSLRADSIWGPADHVRDDVPRLLINREEAGVSLGFGGGFEFDNGYR